MLVACCLLFKRNENGKERRNWRHTIMRHKTQCWYLSLYIKKKPPQPLIECPIECVGKGKTAKELPVPPPPPSHQQKLHGKKTNSPRKCLSWEADQDDEFTSSPPSFLSPSHCVWSIDIDYTKTDPRVQDIGEEGECREGKSQATKSFVYLEGIAPRRNCCWGFFPYLTWRRATRWLLNWSQHMPTIKPIITTKCCV